MRRQPWLGFFTVIGLCLLLWWAAVLWHEPEAARLEQNDLVAETPSASTQISQPSPIPSLLPTVTGHEFLPQPRKRRKIAEVDRDSLAALLALPRRAPFTLNSRDHALVSARAVPAALYRTDMGRILLKQNGFSIVAQEGAAEDSGNELVIHGTDRPVLLNPASGRLEIVTGTLLIKVADSAAAARVAERNGFKLLTLDTSIATAFFRVPDNYHLLAGLKQLASDPDAGSVEVEIVQGEVEAR